MSINYLIKNKTSNRIISNKAIKFSKTKTNKNKSKITILQNKKIFNN